LPPKRRVGSSHVDLFVRRHSALTMSSGRSFMIRLPGCHFAGAIRACRAIMLIASVTALSAHAASSDIREHQLKAAAVYNIVAFTEWPATAFASTDAPLVIGVFGRGPVAALLDYHLANETWQGRRITLRQITSAADARSCHVLYVSPSQLAAWQNFAGQSARLPLLTVSDADNFASQGGIAQLAIERNELRLIVNVGVARACGLTISSKVLRLARVIDDRKS
jgi:hypothetical protein